MQVKRRKVRVLHPGLLCYSEKVGVCLLLYATEGSIFLRKSNTEEQFFIDKMHNFYECTKEEVKEFYGNRFKKFTKKK